MWKSLVVVGLLAATAHADDSTNQAQTLIAHDAAMRGHCDVVEYVAAQVRASDADYYASMFLTDAPIAACMAPPSVPPVAPPAPPASDEPAPGSGEPPLSAVRLSGEVVLGAGVSALAGFLGVVLGASTKIAGCGPDEEECDVKGGIYGGIAGLGIGAPIGVYLGGSIGRETGSLGATFGGSAIAVVAGAGFLLVGSRTSGPGAVVFIATAAVLPTVGAIIGFNLTRRFDHVTVMPVANRNTIGIAGTF